MLPPARCALTAPFHPYPPSPSALRPRASAWQAPTPSREGNLSCRAVARGAKRRDEGGRYIFCATFLRVAPTGCYPAHCPAEFGLSSRLRTSALRRRRQLAASAIVASGREATVCRLRRGPLDYPSVSCEIWYCSSFLYKLLRGVSMTSAVFEIFQRILAQLRHQYARSEGSLNSRNVPPGRLPRPRGCPAAPASA